MRTRAPVVFIGHGSPMNAVQTNTFTESLGGLREIYPEPRAILCVSAHWMTEGSWVTGMKSPKTIHDFYGFPQELFDVQYPAPGSPEVAEFVRANISEPQVHVDTETWGIDHGTWSVLRHVFPEAKIPVLQLSIYMAQPPEYHYKLGQELRKLRDQGILIIGSGNIVHNLRKLDWNTDATPFEWAVEFDEWMKKRLLERDDKAVVNDFAASPAGRLSVPSPDHYYPLLYTLGAADRNETVCFHFEGIQNSSISMRTLSFGA
jgi:4,5-DOPA dioxygenase extradiol